MLLLVIQRPYITIIPKSSARWGEMYDRCGEQTRYKLSMMRSGSCTAKQKINKIHLLDQLNHSQQSTHDHLTAIYYLKSLYRPYNLRRKLMKELFILMRPLRLCKDNPTTLISKYMPQYRLISLKSLHYKSVINPSRIFTYHYHG